MKNLTLFTILTLMTLPSLAQNMNTSNQVLLSEKFLKESLKENPPTIDQIEATFLGARIQQNQIDDQFNTNISGSAQYYETDEKQFATFIPVTSPTTNYEVKVQRRFKRGVTVGVRGFSEQFSNNFVKNASTTGVSLQLGVDLWKDLLGKRSYSQYMQAQAGSEQAKWQGQIAKKSFFNELRKIYWSLVANQESIRITQELLKTSKKQVSVAQDKLKKNIADKGEVAKYQSQLASRKANIVSLKYERESIIQVLKELLPHISLKNIKLDSYDIDKTIVTVLSCTSKIASEAQPPLKYTYYDEIVQLINQQYEFEKKTNSLYDDVDVQLQTEVGYKGRDNSYSNSFNDLGDNGRKNFAVGLTFSVPLESKKKETREILQDASQRKYRAQKNKELGRVKSFHTQTVSQVSLLREIIKNQNANTRYLRESLKTTQKKYKQARLSVEQLVSEQDAFLQSNLNEIQTKLTVINTVLDYLSIYTDTPCELNNI